ncbi:DUF4347 domain-containing protein, partial [Microcystis aeruginosa]|uniref:DUF4347 domain-containing protein n=1 Tax=Microcystis aeruginosa TaxID=1126 RepID=UPI00232CD3B6
MSRQTNLNQSVVFLDAGVSDYQSLQAGVIPEVATVILSANKDGIEQISAFLQQNPQITTIHLVSHGAPGCLYLGNCQLNLTNIYDYRQQLQNWAKINRILLYGCQVAAGDAGTEFIEKLHQLTGATVMASATPTGSSRGGGNWELEVIVSRAESEQDLNISLAFDGGTLATYEGVFALSLVGSYDTPGEAHDVKVVGNYAYVADFSLGLQIIDISNPTNPTLIGNYDTSGSAMDVQIVGNYAYVADYASGLQIIDISNPTNPTLTGNYSDWPLGSAYGLEVVGNYAYVASDYQGLTIIDISNPSNPTLIGNYDTSSRALEVQVIGNYAYVADYESGLQIIDVSNPENPTLKGNYDTPGIASDVEVVGNYAYVADGWDGGLQIIDISNPTNPIFIGNYDTNSVANDVEVVGNYAYVADDMAGLKIIDISNPTNPILIDSYDDFSTVAYGVEVVGNYAYVADYFDGLKIIDVSGFNNPSPLPSVTLAVSTTSVTEDGTTNLVYTFTRTGDTTNPLTVNFTTVDNTDSWKTAIFNTDYSQTGAASFPNYSSETGTVTFAANSATATVTIDPTADTTVESDETVSLTLTSGTGYTVGTPNAATGTIENDDVAIPTLAIAATSANQTEGNSGSKAFTFTVTRSVNTTGTNNVNWAVTGSGSNPANATDFVGGVLPSGTLSFAVGETSKVITVDVQGDTTVELDENFTVTLSNPTNGATITTATAIGTINNDDFIGTSGSDTLAGTSAADAMTGLAGNDTYTVNDAGDLVIEALNQGTDTVQASISYTLTDNVENLTLTGTANLNGTGNNLNNILTGNSGNNILTGLAGNDSLDGKAGADTMIGGLGNDTYTVDNTGDIVTENLNEGTDTVQASISYTLTDNVENLTLTGTANLNGTGNNLNNILTGNSGNNILTGLAGNDSLDGKAGADTMIGGLGNDTYT